MRSRPFKIDMKDRLWDKRHSIHRAISYLSKRFCVFVGRKLLTGVRSAHRMPAARKFRTQLRIQRYVKRKTND